MYDTIREVVNSVIENSKDGLLAYVKIGDFARELLNTYGDEVFYHLGYWALVGGTPDVMALPVEVEDFRTTDLPNGELTDFINNIARYMN